MKPRITAKTAATMVQQNAMTRRISGGGGVGDMAVASVTARPSKAQAQLTYGDTGLQRSGGWVSDDIDQCMNDIRRRSETFQKMATDSTVAGALLAYTSMFRDADAVIEAAGESREQKKARDDVEHYLANMATDFRDMMSEVATMFQHGYSVLEVTYARKTGSKFKGRIVPELVELRAQDTITEWFFTETGRPVGFRQYPTIGGKQMGARDVPLAKCMHIRTVSNKSNPLGESVLRGAVTDWFYKHRIAEIEGVGIERDLAGLPVMRIPSVVMSSQDPNLRSVFNAYKQMVKDIRRDEKEGLVLPSDRDDKGNLYYELELLNSKGSRNFDTTAIIKRYDVGISISMLADFLLLGHSNVGSFSLSSNKTELFTVALSSFLGVTQQEMQRRLIDDVWRYNGLPERTKPTIKFAPIELPDLDVLGNYVRNISRAGARLFPDEALENELRDRAGLPKAPLALSGPLPPPATPDQRAGDNSRAMARAPGGENQMDPDVRDAARDAPDAASIQPKPGTPPGGEGFDGKPLPEPGSPAAERAAAAGAPVAPTPPGVDPKDKPDVSPTQPLAAPDAPPAVPGDASAQILPALDSIMDRLLEIVDALDDVEKR